MRDKIKIQLNIPCVKYSGLKQCNITVIVRTVAVFMGKTDNGQNAGREKWNCGKE
jgi:hypothetical protein